MFKVWTEASHYQTNIFPCLADGSFPESRSFTYTTSKQPHFDRASHPPPH